LIGRTFNGPQTLGDENKAGAQASKKEPGREGLNKNDIRQKRDNKKIIYNSYLGSCKKCLKFLKTSEKGKGLRRPWKTEHILKLHENCRA
jgi:hypothetical protein